MRLIKAVNLKSPWHCPVSGTFVFLLVAILSLAWTVPVQAAITANVSLSGYTAFLADNPQASYGEVRFYYSASPHTNGTYDAPANGGNAILGISSDVSNVPVALGSTPGYFTVVFSAVNGSGTVYSQARNCVTSPIDFLTQQYLSNPSTLDVTITCVRRTPPVLKSAVTDSTGTHVTLTFDEDVSTSSVGTGDFAVKVNGTQQVISGVQTNATQVVIDLTKPIEAGATVTVDYVGYDSSTLTGHLYDNANNYEQNFSGQPVTNASTYLPPPSVGNLSATIGPAAGGGTVVITGTNFNGATGVNFGTAPASSFTVNSNTQITATAPAGTGTVHITVTTPGGTSGTTAADQYTYGYTVDPSVNGGLGTIAPSAQQVVLAGQTTSFTLTPDANYGISGIGGTCGGRLTDYQTYTTNTVTANCTVIASFQPIMSSVTGAVEGGTGTATVSGGPGACGFASAQFVPSGSIGSTLPPWATPVQSGLQFSSNECAAGAAITVTITYPNPLPAGAVLYKYGPQRPGDASTWFPLRGATLSGDRTQFTYTITDNAAGDSNPAVGYISDPVLPVTVVNTPGASIPTLSAWSMLMLSGLLVFGAAIGMRGRV